MLCPYALQWSQKKLPFLCCTVFPLSTNFRFSILHTMGVSWSSCIVVLLSSWCVCSCIKILHASAALGGSFIVRILLLICWYFGFNFMRNSMSLLPRWILTVFFPNSQVHLEQMQVGAGLRLSNSSHSPFIFVKKLSTISSGDCTALLILSWIEKSCALEVCPYLSSSSSQISFAVFNHYNVLAIFSSMTERSHRWLKEANPSQRCVLYPKPFHVQY